MLSTKRAQLTVKVLACILVGVLSFCILAPKVPRTNFIRESIESVESSSSTVMMFSAATLSTSLAISALPDDFASPLANLFADMNFYFVLILVILFLEKLLILYGVSLTFAYVIPTACVIGSMGVLLKRDALKNLAIRLAVLGLSVAFVVPCSTHLTNYVASDLKAYVESTIAETEAGAAKLNEATEGGAEDETIFNKLSELFQTAINGISDLMLHFQNMIRKCMNSIAILFLTNFIMPLLSFFILKWILKETFNITIMLPQPSHHHHSHRDSDFHAPRAQLDATGE